MSENDAALHLAVIGAVAILPFYLAKIFSNEQMGRLEHLLWCAALFLFWAPALIRLYLTVILQ